MHPNADAGWPGGAPRHLRSDMGAPTLFGRSDKLRENTRNLRGRAVHLRIEAADIFCNVAENELRWEPPERTRAALQKIRQSLAEIRHHIQEPGAFDPVMAAELEKLLAKVETRAASIEEHLNARTHAPRASDSDD